MGLSLVLFIVEWLFLYNKLFVQQRRGKKRFSLFMVVVIPPKEPITAANLEKLKYL